MAIETKVTSLQVANALNIKKSTVRSILIKLFRDDVITRRSKENNPNFYVYSSRHYDKKG